MLTQVPTCLYLKYDWDCLSGKPGKHVGHHAAKGKCVTPPTAFEWNLYIFCTTPTLAFVGNKIVCYLQASASSHTIPH